MAVIGVVLAAPVACISFLALMYDIFYLGKGLTGSAVQLLLGLLTAATGGLGVSMFSRTTMFSQVSSMASGGLSAITGLPEPPAEPRPRVKPRGG